MSSDPHGAPWTASDIDEDVFTMEQAAQLKGVSYHTVSRAIRRGALPARRLGKMAFIKKSDLQAWAPKYDRAPMQYRDRTPVPDAKPSMIDLASTERVHLAGQLSALIEVSEAAIRELALDSILDLICERLASGLGLRRVGMWRTDRGRGTAALIASHGTRIAGLLDLVDLADASRSSGLALMSDGGSGAGDVPTGGADPSHLNSSTIVIPLRLGDRWMGHVIADRNEHALPLTAQDYEFGRALVNIGCLAIAVQEARLAAMTTVQPKTHPVHRAATA
jgi:excisionase family DNA binding protein